MNSDALPGNPYASPLPAGDARTQATLALAHEQRTATLVNVVRMYADLGMAEHATEIIDAISNRLGGYDHE